MIFNQIIQTLYSLPFTNVDLLIVGVITAAIMLLGIVIYFNDRHSITNRTFVALAIWATLWGILNYISYQTNVDASLTLWLLRIVLFLAVWFAYYLFKLMYVFPEKEKTFPTYYKTVFLPLVVIISLFTLTPYIFPSIAETSAVGTVSKTVVLPGIYLFGAMVFFLIFGSFYLLIKKIRHAGKEEKTPYRLILVGTIITFTLIIIFNFILAGIFLNVTYIPLGSLFIFPFVAFTFYAIYKHHLFNIKVAAIAFVAFILTVFSFINILYASSASQIAVNITLFIAVLIGSVILIKSVLKEIEQRERIQTLADDLSKANENQVALIHFITHQVKGFFTKSRNIFSLLTEGDAGPLTPEMQKFVAEGFDSDTKGVAMVEDVLNAANIKTGIVKYNIAPFDISNLVGALVVEYKKMAEDKGLQLIYSCWGKPEHAAAISASGGMNSTAVEQVPNCAIDMKTHANYIVSGDEEQLRQVFKNLIENSIKYTPKGSVTVRLTQSVADSAADHTAAPKVIFSVRDTGVGLTDDDKALLFSQGGRGKDSTKVNVESTGYGLFIAKGIVEAHHGRIWAESEGRDKGTTFYVELPSIQQK
jgi:signal transduction histidine kinase